MFRCATNRCDANRFVWADGLKDKLLNIFAERAMPVEGSNVRLIPAARFISSLYDLGVLTRDTWPPARIVAEMHCRRYGEAVRAKPSYGAEPPPSLSMEECLAWVAHFRVVSFNQKKS